MSSNIWLFITGYFIVFPILIGIYIRTSHFDSKALIYFAIFVILSMFSSMPLLEGDLYFLNNSLTIGVFFIFISPIVALSICTKFEK